MSEFEPAVLHVLEQEGGLVAHPECAGAITNFGISLRFLREVPAERLRRYGIFEPVTEQTINGLVVEQAKFIYQGEFWDGNNFEAIGVQRVCNYVFDMCVNMGTAQGIKLVQRTLCAAAIERGILKDDGILGERTMSMINHYGASLLPFLVLSRLDFYILITELHPKEKVNLNGWTNRCFNI